MALHLHSPTWVPRHGLLLHTCHTGFILTLPGFPDQSVLHLLTDLTGLHLSPLSFPFFFLPPLSYFLGSILTTILEHLLCPGHRASCVPHNSSLEILLCPSCARGDVFRVKGDDGSRVISSPPCCCQPLVFPLCWGVRGWGGGDSPAITPCRLSLPLVSPSPRRGEEWFKGMVGLEGEWGLWSPGSGSEAARGGAVSALFSFLHISQSQLCPCAGHDWVRRSVRSWVSALEKPTCPHTWATTNTLNPLSNEGVFTSHLSWSPTLMCSLLALFELLTFRKVFHC